MDYHVFGCTRRPLRRHTAPHGQIVGGRCELAACDARFSMGLTVNFNLSIGAGCTREHIFMLWPILIQGTLFFKIAGVDISFEMSYRWQPHELSELLAFE